MMFPVTTRAWRRLKLLIAELLVLSLVKGDHSHGYTANLFEAADAIKEFRKIYYPRAPWG